MHFHNQMQRVGLSGNSGSHDLSGVNLLLDVRNSLRVSYIQRWVSGGILVSFVVHLYLQLCSNLT